MSAASPVHQSVAAVEAPAPDIAVVIPTRNRRHVLDRALESVFAQSHQNFELVVVDDCSTDLTKEYLASIRDPRLKWLRFDQWSNQNAARNAGVAMSCAPILSFLDSDDRYLPHRLEETLKFFRGHADVDVRLSSFTFSTGSKSDDMVNPDAIFVAEDLELYLIGYCLYLGGSAISMRRSAFDDLRGFDETLSRMTDRDLLLRVARNQGCASASLIDWVKVRSDDSVSSARIGRIATLSAMYQRHPVISEKYLELFRYLVAREIVAPLLNFKLGETRLVFREASFHQNTAVPAWRVLSDYWRGRRRRRALRRQLTARFAAGQSQRRSRVRDQGSSDDRARAVFP